MKDKRQIAIFSLEDIINLKISFENYKKIYQGPTKMLNGIRESKLNKKLFRKVLEKAQKLDADVAVIETQTDIYNFFTIDRSFFVEYYKRQ